MGLVRLQEWRQTQRRTRPAQPAAPPADAPALQPAAHARPAYVGVWVGGCMHVCVCVRARAHDQQERRAT
eukprot:1137439-Pelagomonas_calceolata.AAC.6